MTMFAPLPQNDLLPMELGWTLSRVDSPAKILVLPESKPVLAKGREAACGVSAYALLASYDPDTQSLKMSQTCFLDLLNVQGDGSPQSCETWPASGMMQNGMIYQLPTLETGTGGGEYGYLPTVIKSTASGAASSRWLGSATFKNNLHEYLRDGPEDPKHVKPDFCEMLMGFPIGHTELQPVEIP